MAHPPAIGARWIVRCAFALLASLVALVVSSDASADATSVPIALQAELLMKVAPYDRNFMLRAAGHVHVLVVVKSNDIDSDRASRQITAALSAVETIGGMPHDETPFVFTSAPALATAVRLSHASVVYLAPGLDAEMLGIASALDGVDVLSVAAVPSYVRDGAVLGFSIVGGHPKLVLNVAQAHKQRVAFAPDLVRIMQVYP